MIITVNRSSTVTGVVDDKSENNAELVSSHGNTASETAEQSNSRHAEASFDDPIRPLHRALRLGWWGLLVVGVLSLMGWGALRGLPGIYGVLMGAAIGGGFVLLTVLSVLLTSHTNPSTTAVVVLGSWLLKIVVLLGVMLLIRDLTFYDRTAFIVTVVAALIVVLGAETWGILTARVTYVQPE